MSGAGVGFCGLRPLLFGRKPSRFEAVKSAHMSKNQKKEAVQSPKMRSSSRGSASNFVIVMEFRKKIFVFRDIIDLPPCDGSATTNELVVGTMKELHTLFPEIVSRDRLSEVKGASTDRVLIYFCEALRSIGDSWTMNSEWMDKETYDLYGRNDQVTSEKLVEIALSTLNCVINLTKDKFDLMDEDEQSKYGSRQANEFGKALMRSSFSENSSSCCASPVTPTSVLPDYMGSPNPREFNSMSCSSPLLRSLRVQAIGKLNPIDIKRLSFHMPQNEGTNSDAEERSSSERGSNVDQEKVEEQLKSESFKQRNDMDEELMFEMESSGGDTEVEKTDNVIPENSKVEMVQATKETIETRELILPFTPPSTPYESNLNAIISHLPSPKPQSVLVTPPPVAPNIAAAQAPPPSSQPVVAFQLPTPPPPPPPPSTTKTQPPPPVITGKVYAPPPPPPPSMTTGAVSAPPPPPPPPMVPQALVTNKGAPPPPPPPMMSSNGSMAPPPPPPPPMMSSNGSMPPPTPPPMMSDKGPMPPPPPMPRGNGAAAPPPPPPGAARSLRPKKAQTKLKRSSQMGNLYRLLKGKVEGCSPNGKSNNGRKGSGAAPANGKQGMADALAEMTKRSAYFQQIEEDVQNYTKAINELKTKISTFQTKDMKELMAFHKQVESVLEKLTDETQVLARFEGFPQKKLEAMRMAAALYSKLHGVVTELQNWKIEAPLNQLLDRTERYFNKIKGDMDALERTKDEESKKFKSHNIHFDFDILVHIKESIVDVSSNCMELALKERREAKAAEIAGTGTKKTSACAKMLWRAFQFAFRVYTFAGGHDERADKLTRELAHEIETDPQHQ